MIDGPSGKYRFLAAFQRVAAAAGGEAEFYLADPAEMPPVQSGIRPLGRRCSTQRVAEVARHQDACPHAGSATFTQVILAGARPAPGVRRHSANWPGRSLAVPTPYFFLPTYFRTTTAIERVGCRW